MLVFYEFVYYLVKAQSLIYFGNINSN
ncbi:hypothetical protein [Colwellia sp. BRX10-4]